MLAHVRKMPSSLPWQTTVPDYLITLKLKARKLAMSQENRPYDSMTPITLSYPFLTKPHHLCYYKLH